MKLISNSYAIDTTRRNSNYTLKAGGSYEEEDEQDEQETSDELLASRAAAPRFMARSSSQALRLSDKINTASVGGAPGEPMLRQANQNNATNLREKTLRCDIIRQQQQQQQLQLQHSNGSKTIYSQPINNNQLSSTNSSMEKSHSSESHYLEEFNSLAPIVTSSSNQHTLINYNVSNSDNIEMQRRLLAQRLGQFNQSINHCELQALPAAYHQEDPHLYCSVGGSHTEQATTFQHHNNHNNTIYKSPQASMNHSYQQLVEKLNEKKAFYNNNQTHSYQPNFRPENCMPGQLYANGPIVGYNTNCSRQVANNNYSTLLPTSTSNRHVISPITRAHNNNYNSSSSSDNFRPAPAGKVMYFGGPSAGHAQRQLKWAFRRPNCWKRLFVVLISCLLFLLLLLIGSLTLFTSTTTSRNYSKANELEQQQHQQQLIHSQRIPASGAPNWAPNSNHQQDFLPLPVAAPNSTSQLFINNAHLLAARFPNLLPPEVEVMHSWTTTTTTTSSSSSTTTPPRPSSLPSGESGENLDDKQLEVSTQSYWRLNVVQGKKNFFNNNNECNANCNGNGHCSESANGQCACFAGFSGPTCSNVDCPAGCSRRGECKLRPGWPLNNLAAHATESLAFLSSSSELLSSCGGDSARAANSTTRRLQLAGLHDSRLRWACECAPEFTGRDCSQRRELNCSNGLDDDQDGLADCEDDDCCSQSACRDSLLCHRPPEPSKVLARQPPAQLNLDELTLSSTTTTTRRANNLFAHWRFLIANGSLQSYSQERAFERARVAIVRGRVRSVGPHRDGIGSVRVGVMESAAIGFTLTRQDGHFDLLVNGDEWITLQFHRDAYAPVKRRTLARSLTITTLDEEVQMALSSEQQLPSEPRLPAWQPFGLHWHAHLGALTDWLKQHSDERRSVRACLDKQIGQLAHSIRQEFARAQVEPKLIDLTGTPLHSFALVSAPTDSYTTKLRLNSQLEFAYNSATFPPASSIVKPLISLQLVPENYTNQPNQLVHLKSIDLQLDIEGQLKREHLEVPTTTATTVKSALNYQFAWNRRNVYDQKVYGFGELNVRAVYEFGLKRGAEGAPKPVEEVMRACGLPAAAAAAAASSQEFKRLAEQLGEQLTRRLVTFKGRVHMEAHPMDQHADLGHWSLASSARYDPEREHLYLGTGVTLPFQLAYPPVVSTPISLLTTRAASNDNQATKSARQPAGRLLARGPNGSMFVVVMSTSSLTYDELVGNDQSRLLQLDSTGTRRLLDLPLSIITSKFQPQIRAQKSGEEHELELVYNNYESALYVASQLAGKIVRVSLSSLVLLNRTLSSSHSATLAPDEEIDIEPLCGFGVTGVASVASVAESYIATTLTCKSLRLVGPHSMTLDETNNLLYFIDGPRSLLALNLATNSLVNLSANLPFLDAGAHCRPGPPGARMALDEPLHSLAWSAADSALYFVHGSSAIVRLGADLSATIVAQGINQQQQQHHHHHHQRMPSVCSANTNDEPLPVSLGSIKSLAIDGHQLVIVHQRDDDFHFQLAKMELGIGNQLARQVIDLHSPERTWNPLIGRFIGGGESRTNKTGRNFNWLELSRRPAMSEKIPFIHLINSNGFERIDSLAINSDGTMFLLNERERSIRLISAYSPSRFNAHESNAQTMASLFVNTATSNPNLLLPTTTTTTTTIRKPITSVTLANPMAQNDKQQQNELLEFDYTSGLLLTRTRISAAHAAHAAHTRRWEFHYRILSNANNKLDAIDQLNSTPTPHLDEDDQNDLDTKRLVLDYMRHHNSDRSSLAMAATSAYVRLSSIKASHESNQQQQQQQPNEEYEFVRTYSNSRFVLQAIKLNQKQICELTTDRSGVLTTFIEQTAPIQRTSWTELVYDPKTYLLQNVISKTVSRESSISSLLASNNYRQLMHPPPPDSMFHSLFSQTPTPTTNNDHKLMRSTKRIIYDEIFNHYCDLFIVDA